MLSSWKGVLEFLRWNVVPATAGILLVVMGSQMGSCGLSTDTERQSTYDKVKKYLTDKNCDAAIALIDPIYFNSPDNDARMLRASAYACKAGVELVPMLFQFSNNTALCDPSVPTCSGLWSLLAEVFTGYVDDEELWAGWFSMDSLTGVLKIFGQAVLPLYRIDLSTNNIGSKRYLDRDQNANIYMIFAASAVIGSTLNREGAPDAMFAQTMDIPWDTYQEVAADPDACAFGNALVNLMDAVQDAPSSLGSEYADMQTALAQTFNDACEAGCDGSSGSNCNTTCTGCPIGTRYRDSCDATNDMDPETCAVAGLVEYINFDW